MFNKIILWLNMSARGNLRVGVRCVRVAVGPIPGPTSAASLWPEQLIKVVITV